jgi:hypothetical protein
MAVHAESGFGPAGGGGSGGGGGLTDIELRATPVSVATDAATAREITLQSIDFSLGNALDVFLSSRASEATLALIRAKTDNVDVALSTRATEATLALIKAKTDNLDVLLSTRTKPADVQGIRALTAADTVTIVSAALDVALSTRATEATLATRATEATLALIKAKTDNLDALLSTRTKPADQQHVIIDASAAIAVTGPMTVAQFAAATETVTGSVAVTNLPATQPVSAVALPLPAGASTEATLALIKAKTDNLDVLLSTRTKPADVQGIRALTAADIVTIVAAVLAKGTQGANGLSTQDLKDAGRNPVNYFMALPVLTTAAEVMQALTGYKGGVAVAANVSPAVVTAGKIYRVESVTLIYVSVAAAGSALFRLRANLGGAGVVGSPLVMNFVIGTPAAAAGVSQTEVVPIPDGLEFQAGTGIAVGMVGLSAVQALAAAGYGMAIIQGYEY